MIMTRTAALSFAFALLGGPAAAQSVPDAANMTLLGHTNLGAGRVVMQDRHVLTLDQAAIVAAAKVWGQRVQKSLATPPSGSHN